MYLSLLPLSLLIFFSFTSHCVLTSLLVNKTNLFSQPPVSLSCFTSCRSVTPQSCVAVIFVSRCTFCGPGPFQRLPRMLPSFFLCVCISYFESYLHCRCAFVNKIVQVYAVIIRKEWSLPFSFFLPLFVSYLSNCWPHRPSSTSLHDGIVSLSSCWVQKTAGTSYKEWCQISPLNLPRPLLYPDSLAPGKVRLPYKICQ